MNYAYLEVKSICEEYVNLGFIQPGTYYINDDLSVNVTGDVRFHKITWDCLPIKFNIVNGNFSIMSFSVTTMHNFPQFIGGSLMIEGSSIESLYGLPETIIDTFYAPDRELIKVENIKIISKSNIGNVPIGRDDYRKIFNRQLSIMKIFE